MPSKRKNLKVQVKPERNRKKTGKALHETKLKLRAKEFVKVYLESKMHMPTVAKAVGVSESLCFKLLKNDPRIQNELKFHYEMKAQRINELFSQALEDMAIIMTGNPLDCFDDHGSFEFERTKNDPNLKRLVSGVTYTEEGLLKEVKFHSKTQATATFLKNIDKIREIIAPKGEDSDSDKVNIKDMALDMLTDEQLQELRRRAEEQIKALPISKLDSSETSIEVLDD